MKFAIKHEIKGRIRIHLARNGLRGLVHHEVLHGGNVEQQRKENGQNYQQQNRRREHLSQYFYTFAHQELVITCKFNENS